MRSLTLFLQKKIRLLSLRLWRHWRGVRSPTYAGVAQPLHSRSIGRWQHYAAWLEPHLSPLRELLKEFEFE